MNQPRHLFLAVVALGIFWGLSIPLTKIAVSTGHAPMGLIFWQQVISAVCLLGFAILRRSRIPLTPRHLIFYTVIALLGTVIPSTFNYWAAAHLPGGVLALIIALVPMFSLLVALGVGLERFELVRLAGVALGVVAIALLVLPQSSLPDPAKAVFVFIALLAPLCYGLEGAWLALRQLPDVGPVGTLLGACCVGSVLAGAIALAGGDFIDPRAGLDAAEWALVGSAIIYAGAYAGYIGLVAAAGPVFAAQIGYWVTPSGMLASMVLLNETPSRWMWAALALLLIGLFLVQPRRARREALPG